MTGQEMLNKIDAARAAAKPIRVSLSRDGTFLALGDEQFPITNDQAARLWEYLPLLPAAGRQRATHFLIASAIVTTRPSLVSRCV